MGTGRDRFHDESSVRMCDRLDTHLLGYPGCMWKLLDAR
jgi:hypothetical protein